jgi:hypothetical protein
LPPSGGESAFGLLTVDARDLVVVITTDGDDLGRIMRNVVPFNWQLPTARHDTGCAAKFMPGDNL